MTSLERIMEATDIRNRLVALVPRLYNATSDMQVQTINWELAALVVRIEDLALDIGPGPDRKIDILQSAATRLRDMIERHKIKPVTH